MPKTTTRCSWCGEPTTTKRQGSDTWTVHVSTGQTPCPPSATRCPIATPRHVLADGTLCPDPRHRTERYVTR